MGRLAFLLALVLFLAPLRTWAEDPPGEEPGEQPGEEKPAEEEATGITWVHDYEEGKAKAAEAKKGLFVYMTPTWFT